MNAKLFIAALGVMGMVAIFSILFLPVFGWLTDLSDLFIFPNELQPGEICPIGYIGNEGDQCKLYRWITPSLVGFFGVSVLAVLVVLMWPVE